MAKNSLKIAKKASFYPKTPPKVAQNRFQGGSGHLSGLKLCRTQKKWSGTSEGGGFINGPIYIPLIQMSKATNKSSGLFCCDDNRGVIPENYILV